MTTYNSYEAAKIANPEYAIFEYLRNFGADKEIIELFDIQSREMKECNPAGHCMTVEKFLADGYKLVEGDLILDEGSVYLVSNCKEQDHWFETESVNEPDCDDDRRYILRAAALEEKPIEKIEWDGEGLPPVGVECWFNFKVTHPQKCKVKYIGKTVCVYESADGNEYSTLISEVGFSKIETKQQREDRERLERVNAMPKMDLEKWFWEVDAVDKSEEYRLGVKGVLGRFEQSIKISLDKTNYRKEV